MSQSVEKTNLSDKLLNLVLVFVVLAFPFSTIAVPHGLSAIYGVSFLLGIFSIFYFKGQSLSEVEKVFFVLVVVYLFVVALTYFFIEVTDFDVSRLRRNARFLAVLPIIYLISRIALSEKWLWYGVSIGAIGAGCVAMQESWSLFASGRWHYRASGNTHHIIFGNISLLLAFISFVGFDFFKRSGKYLLLIPFIALLFGVLASMLSGARGGWVAIPALAIILFWQYRSMFSIKKQIAFFVSALIMASLLYVVPQTGIQTRVEQATYEIRMYSAHGNISTSLGARFQMWQDAWGIFQSSPIVGSGPYAFVRLLNADIEAGRKTDVYAILTEPHNEYLRMLASHGLIGLVGLLVLLGGIFMIFYKSSTSEGMVSRVGYAGMMLVAGYAFFGLSASFLDYRRTITFFCLLVSVLIGYISSKQLSKA